MGEEKGLVVSGICCKLTICDLFPCILNSLLLSTSSNERKKFPIFWKIRFKKDKNIHPSCSWTTGWLLIIELFNLAMIQPKINIKAHLRWFFCTTEWDILIFSFLNDLNRTFNRYFYTLLKYYFLGMSEVKVKKQHYKIFNTRTFWSITRPSLGL